jgi:hypothetical protein
MAPGWAGACAWAVLGHDRGRRGVVVLAGLWAVGQKGFRGILEFEFEFEGSIQIQIPHIGITQNENQTRKSNNQFKTRKIAIKSEMTSNNHTNI